MGHRPHLSFCAFKTAWFAPELQVSICSSPHLCFFCMYNGDFRSRLISLYESLTSSVVLSTHNSVLSTRVSRLYGFQPSPVVLCMQNSVICTRMTSLYVFQPSSVVFCMQNGDFRSRLISLYGSQTSSVVLCMQRSVISTRITSLYVSQPSSVAFASKTATFGPELQVSMDPRQDLSFCACTTSCLTSELQIMVWCMQYSVLRTRRKSLYLVPSLTCGFVHAK